MATECSLGGMPTREGDLSIEAHGMEPIPECARYGSVDRVFTVWFTPNLVPAAFFIGTLVTLDFLKLGFVTSLLAIVVGNLVGSVIVGLLTTMGPKTGHGPAARRPACRSASRSSCRACSTGSARIGWDGINSLFGAFALTILIPAPAVRRRPARSSSSARAALGIFGYEAIHLFEKWGAVVARGDVRRS